MIETGNFHGLRTQVIGNRQVRVEFLAEKGLRLVRLAFGKSSHNLLAELPDFKVSTPYGDYDFLGGHRLWHAPEAIPRTYIPEAQAPVVEELADGVRLTQPTEAHTGIRKMIELHLHPDRPRLTLHHRLWNDGLWPVELAPWAITQFPLGGWAIVPQTSQPVDSTALLPNRHLVLWPYTRWHDSRLHLRDDYLCLAAHPQLPPFKVGCLNTAGWIGYLREGLFFCKQFEPRPAETYPDRGCNVEIYCNDQFIELESLGPLVSLQPGESTLHTETWEIAERPSSPHSPEAVIAAIQSAEAADEETPRAT